MISGIHLIAYNADTSILEYACGREGPIIDSHFPLKVVDPHRPTPSVSFSTRCFSCETSNRSPLTWSLPSTFQSLSTVDRSELLCVLMRIPYDHLCWGCTTGWWSMSSWYRPCWTASAISELPVTLHTSRHDYCTIIFTSTETSRPTRLSCWADEPIVSLVRRYPLSFFSIDYTSINWGHQVAVCLLRKEIHK